jgi:nickel-dependent lactate racemase
MEVIIKYGSRYTVPIQARSEEPSSTDFCGRKEPHSEIMKRFGVPYGKRNFIVEIDERNISGIIEAPKIGMPGGKTTLAEAIQNPLDHRSLKEFLGGASGLSIMVNDGARPTRTAWVIDLIEEAIKDKDVQFIIATGAHRCPTDSELRRIFNGNYDRYKDRIAIHDARDENAHECVGKTRYGNEVWLNRLVTRTDKVVVIGSVEPHYFAGLTGGRKSLLPGVAAYRTIEQNHSLALLPGAHPLNLDGNPIHEEMIDCIKMFGKDRIYAVQMILDPNHDVWRAFAGAIDLTFDYAVCDARRFYSVTITQSADVVVTISTPPFDVDLYQTLKAIEHGRLALKPGGILIVVSPCPEGLGPMNFARLFEDSTAVEVAAHKAKIDYRLGDHNAHNLLTLREQHEIWAVTNIAGSVLRTAKIEKFRSLQAALNRAIKQKGSNTKMLFLLNGSLTVPILK